MGADYILYGSDHSYFTGKVRPYLRYKGLDFEERLATREVYKQIILPRVGAPIIPVLETAAGEIVQDTTDIIDLLESRHPQPSVYPQGARQKLVALLLEHYADEWLVIPAMHYRWSVLDQQYEFIMREFGRMSAPDETPENQVQIGEKISQPFRGSIASLGIEAATIPAIEQVYAEFLQQLDEHFTRHPFLLGTRPSIGDFGLMGPLYAHLGRDPVPRAMMQAQAPEVFRWLQRMNEPEPVAGEFLAADEVPTTLLPILKTLCRDFLPDVLDVIVCNAAWIEEN
ncbi:MAG: glutathione S-transferase family protein, partial [Lysobacterales bacterium]